MLFAVLIATHMTNEGESNWFSGLQLLFVYALLGLVFAFA
jgi:Ca2+:H+ antiporter